MSETELRAAETEAVSELIKDNNERINGLESELEVLRKALTDTAMSLQQANGLVAELRARLYSIGLLLRP